MDPRLQSPSFRTGATATPSFHTGTAITLLSLSLPILQYLGPTPDPVCLVKWCTTLVVTEYTLPSNDRNNLVPSLSVSLTVLLHVSTLISDFPTLSWWYVGVQPPSILLLNILFCSPYIIAFGEVFSFFGTPTITSEKFKGKSYISWSTSIELRSLGQRFIITLKMVAKKFHQRIHQRILSSGRS